ncbi:uncharacterized protein LOC133316529 [Gastrolobium bilobum]|uniref:uncharacterized protein LOC133316529 n=1 Tax=Gastrolobium bilobum TaxID=150636 RepID=UPI002AB23569|nr:uncharacterized protein LOC133316529 [Gastrolobium bilobum]
MAWSVGYRNVIIENDSSSVITLLTKNGVAICECLLISRIRIWVQRNWAVSFQHTYREGNSCADWLANSILDDREHISKRIWWEPPLCIRLLLMADLASVSRPHDVVCSL